VTRVFTIWPADRDGVPASSAGAWRQDRHWLVLDITGGDMCIVEGPVTREVALRRELELRASARQIAKAAKRAPIGESVG
jgi:hypothetical protein